MQAGTSLQLCSSCDVAVTWQASIMPFFHSIKMMTLLTVKQLLQTVHILKQYLYGCNNEICKLTVLL